MTRSLVASLLLLSGCAASRPAEFPGAFGILAPKGKFLVTSSSQLGPALPMADPPWLIDLRRFETRIRVATDVRVRGRPGRAINLLHALAKEIARTPRMRLFDERLERKINAELAQCRAAAIPLEPALVELAEPVKLPRLGGVAPPPRKQLGP